MLYWRRISTLTIGVQVQSKTILELKFMVVSLKAIEAHTKEGLEGYKEEQYVRKKGDDCRYVEMVDPTYSSSLYELKKLPFHTVIEFFEVEAYVILDGSHNKEKNIQNEISTD